MLKASAAHHDVEQVWTRRVEHLADGRPARVGGEEKG